MTKEETGLRDLLSCTTFVQPSTVVIFQVLQRKVCVCVCVAYNSECYCGTETPHLHVDTQILSSMHGQHGDKELADQGDWEGASLCPPWSLEDKHSTDPGGHQAQEPD